MPIHGSPSTFLGRSSSVCSIRVIISAKRSGWSLARSRLGGPEAVAPSTIDIGGEAFNCRVDGPAGAPALVLSNSLGTNLSMWQPQMPALTTRFRVVRYDTRSHGQSPLSTLDYGIDTLGHDVVQLLDALEIRRAHFCGISMGGATGMWLAIHAPERIDRLVLSNTATKFGTPERWNARIEAVREGGMGAIADGVIETWFTPAFRASAHEAV